MDKTAETYSPVHPLIAERWSPRAFKDRPVEPEKLASLLEAARWAASCFNEQPWSFLVATREDEDEFERIAACLVEANSWARKAGVLMLSVASTTFARNGKPNRHGMHDLGLAVGNLSLQAQAEGLSVHQMAGFDAERARTTLSLPPDVEPMAVIAIGYRGSPESLPAELAAREREPRKRKALDTFVFGAGWGKPYRNL